MQSAIDGRATSLSGLIRLLVLHHAAKEPVYGLAMGDKFEDIEHQQFGKDGHEDAVAQIAQIEQALGLADIAQFTAPPPPKA
jgi:hypothetical protein